MRLDGRFRRRDALRAGAAAAVFAVAFAAAAGAPGLVSDPFVEPFLALVALALLSTAVVASVASPTAVTRFRRAWLVGVGLASGWWVASVWLPEPLYWVLAVPLLWTVVATVESARRPSLPWSVAITSASPVGVVATEIHRVFDFYDRVDTTFLEGLVVGQGMARETVLGGLGAVLLVGVPLGVGAYLLGRYVHGVDGWPPDPPDPDRQTATLVATAIVSGLLGLRLLPIY